MYNPTDSDIDDARFMHYFWAADFRRSIKECFDGHASWQGIDRLSKRGHEKSLKHIPVSNIKHSLETLRSRWNNLSADQQFDAANRITNYVFGYPPLRDEYTARAQIASGDHAADNVVDLDAARLRAGKNEAQPAAINTGAEAALP